MDGIQEAAQDGVSSAANDLAESIDDGTSRLESAIADGTESLSGSISKVADNIVGAVVVGGAMTSAVGYRNRINEIILGFIEMSKEQFLEIRRKNQMIESLIGLQETHGALDYEFAVTRSYAAGTKKGQRRTLLNGLISEGIATESTETGEPLLWIDTEGASLKDYYDNLDELANAIGDVANALTKQKA